MFFPLGVGGWGVASRMCEIPEVQLRIDGNAGTV